MKKKICIVLCLGCIGTVSVVGCSNKNFDSKVTGDNQTTTENVSDILNDQEKKEGVNITVRQSRQSGVARATCPD